MSLNAFPLGVSQGAAFCSRVAERQHLGQNCQQNKHTLVLSPPRFGKTSLVLQTMLENDGMFAVANFFMVMDDEVVQQRLLVAIGRLWMRIIKDPQRAIKVAQTSLPFMHFSLIMHADGLALELTPIARTPLENIQSALLALEQVSRAEQQKVSLFIDEFHYINNLINCSSLEKTLRQVAAQSQYVTYVFSGSNRAMLEKLFNDPARPLYKLCEQLNLNRIEREEYFKYLQKLARQRWETELPIGVIEKILNRTACHPFYVNLLCSRLWQKNTMATVMGVDSEWEKYAREESSRVGRDMENLSLNQSRLLVQIANHTNLIEPTGQQFLQKIKMSGASVLQALNVLLAKDWVYRDERQVYRILDPLIQTVLVN